jgi:aspartyl-tRNA(Asn)/glutamyl-tRNA(Gln) amidotransferase subunit C
MKRIIDREQVRYIAHLARLELSEEEEEKFTRQLGEILAWVDKLKELDTSKVPFTSHVLPLTNVFREDELKESLSEKEALLNAPQKKRSHFQVPKVIGD